jgi:hypothetical protein
MTPNKAYRQDRLWLLVDVAMIAALCGNLLLWILQGLYGLPTLTRWLSPYLPTFYGAYGTYIHPYFSEIDLGFSLFFLGEFVFSWGLAAYFKVWPKWYAYPIFHWYDLLGCIPVGGFKVLRVLRIIGVILRLNRMGVIYIQGWWPYRVLARLSDIVVEEISDRVVVHVLTGVQASIREQGLMEQDLIKRVLQPRKAAIAKAIAGQVGRIAQQQYQQRREDLNALIRQLVHNAVEQNRDIGRLEKIPMLGDFISQSIEHAIYDIAGNVIAEGVDKLKGNALEGLINELVDAVISYESQEVAGNTDALQQTVIDVLEIIKERVAEKEWLKG